MLVHGMVGCVSGGTLFSLVKEINSKVIFVFILKIFFFLALGSVELPTLCNAVSLNCTDIWHANKLQPRKMLSCS